MIARKVPHMIYGADYNPEQWPEEVWEDDVRLMREAGVNLVSLGIFSWARLEPSPGEYDFDWLDRIISLLHENGVMVNLATATASPPPWLAARYPESLPVTQNGVVLHPGARQHYCPSSSAYKERASELVRRIADRYKDHPALAMWHVNNEYGCHVAECYCDTSAEHFREWLRARYGDLDTLNEAWGTAFWSQRYAEWGEILPPRSAPTFANPTQQLDFRRFSSDALLKLYEMEKEILRGATPEIPITTNFMGFFKPVDYWKWALREDLVSDDSYPDPSDPEAHIKAAMSRDLMRSLGDGAPWVLMEQTTVRVNWRERNIPKRPDVMRLWSYGAVARGAEGIMFFQWRQSRAGAEKYHSAMVPHVPTETSRSWSEVSRLGAELGRLDELLGARGEAETAILLDWESWWALELDSKPSTAVRMLEGLYSFYEPLYNTNVSVDFAHPGSDLSSYRLVVAPNLYLVTDDSVENIRRFVADGGTLLMSFFSGIVDAQDHIRLGGYPAPFRELLGLQIEDFVPMATGETNRLDTTGGETCDLWADLIHPEGAAILASYTDDFYAGTPAVTRNVYGEGAAYYLGTRPEERFTKLLVERVCDEAGVRPTAEVPPGVDTVRRKTGAASFLFLLNHNQETVEIRLPSPGRDLLTGKGHDSQLTLDPLGAAILQEERHKVDV
ncbi:MAG: GH42 [uncultured Rubrobacteraceae bacterium]|uniref:Beta-galactosidase n=1 Tax=uncultured Rubrobacteraceae bacterium TaxID=349277 RepID=A0A6J4RDG7_9ACTN|nr:MAG: GH42 [uncultured Rubrobacteraceae bacterium]